MKEFKNRIQIAAIADIDSISGTDITMKPGRQIDDIFSSNDIFPGETDQLNGGSRFYTQTLTVICDKLGDTLYNRYRDRQVVIKLFDTDGGEYLLGNQFYPARCSVAPKLTQDEMAITCDNIRSLLS